MNQWAESLCTHLGLDDPKLRSTNTLPPTPPINRVAIAEVGRCILFEGIFRLVSFCKLRFQVHVVFSLSFPVTLEYTGFTHIEIETNLHVVS